MWGFDAVLDDDESFAADVAADVGGTPDAAAGPAADDDAAAKAKVTDDDEFRKVESTQVLRGGSSRETISFIKKIEQEKKTRANTWPRGARQHVETAENEKVQWTVGRR